MSPSSIEHAAKEAFQTLKTANAFLGSVESCTGGAIAQAITNLSGSSEIFWGSWVTYANEAKEQLGVPLEVLTQHGAVSDAVARSMAEVGLARIREKISKPVVCIATTGVAGPTGGSAEKPVGLCWLGIAWVTAQGEKKSLTKKIQAPAEQDRAANRLFFTFEALRLVAHLHL
jgi:nicotinamide-nucleotide amidase